MSTLGTDSSGLSFYGDGFGMNQVWKRAGLPNYGGGTLNVKRTTTTWNTAHNRVAAGSRTGRLKVKTSEGDGPSHWSHASWMRGR